MALSFEFGNPRIDGWILLHQTYNLVLKCEEAQFAKVGVTPQQYWVLQAVNYLGQYRGGPVTQKDVANLLDRNANSITLIIDRMERAGLVQRRRDLPDRRAIRLIVTEEGQKAIETATGPAWELIRQIGSSLSQDELAISNEIMKKIRAAAMDYLKPGEAIEEAVLDMDKAE